MTNAFGTNFWLYTDAAGACAACGNAVSVTDPFGRVTESLGTPYGLPVSTVWHSGSLVSSNYTEYLAGMTTEEQEAEEYPVAMTDEGGRTRRYDYDTLGRLYRATDLSGATWWTNQFNPDTGALTNVLSPTGETNSYTYDSLDNVKTIQFSDGNYMTNFYNAENRLNGVRLPSGVALTNAYDFAGRLTNRNSSIGETAGFEYNGNDAVTKMTDNTGTTTNLFDAAGRLWGIDYPSGVTNLWQYDSLNRLTNLTWKLSGNQRGDFACKLGAVGHLTNLSDTVNSVSRVFSWEFDRLYRLTNETVTGAAPTGTLGFMSQ